MEIVFIHLGKRLPAHLLKNLERTNHLFPDRSITLIVSSKEIANKTINGVNNVFYYDLKLSPLNKASASILNVKSQIEFWRYSFERILAFSVWHQTQPHLKALHVESDVILLPRFDFERINSNKKLMWANVNSDHDIAALLYSPSADESKWMASRIIEELVTDPTTTDMTGLFKVRNKSPGKIDLLETLPISLEKNQRANTNRPIYDAARIGMWLSGEDPRNHFGFLVKHVSHVDSDVKPHNFEYKVNEIGEVFILVNGAEWQLQNLHVHSKSIKMFEKSNIRKLYKDITDSKNKKIIIEVTPFRTFTILTKKLITQIWKLIDA
jgi:hypothetical protein